MRLGWVEINLTNLIIPMDYNLNGKKVACMVADGFEQSELESPVTVSYTHLTLPTIYSV